VNENNETDLKDVTDSGTSNGLNLTTTHPRSETQLDILASPDAHSFVECAQVHEIVAFDGDRAANERRRRERQSSVHRRALLVVLHPNPSIPAATITISYRPELLSGI